MALVVALISFQAPRWHPSVVHKRLDQLAEVGWPSSPRQLTPDWTTATVLPSRRLRSAISALLVILKDSP